MGTIAAPAAGYDGRPILRQFALLATMTAGVVAAAATAVNLDPSPPAEPDSWSVIRGVVVLSYVVAGAYTWWRGPASRIGVYVAAIGLTYSLTALAASDEAIAHSVGRVAHAAFIVAFVYVFLCFPHDRLTSELERRLVVVLFLGTAVAWLIAVPLVERLPSGGPLISCMDACPENAFQLVATSEGVSNAITFPVHVVTASALLALVVVVINKARSPNRLRRRLVEPVFVSIAVLAVTYAAFTVLQEAGMGPTTILRVAGAFGAISIPVALVVGQIRGRSFALASLAALVSRIGGEPVTPRRIEELLREALGDPTLTLALRGRRGDEWVDARGRTFALPDQRAPLDVTYVRRNGSTVAAVVHDPGLDGGSGLIEGVAATALVLLDNAQLVAELRASRARVVALAQRERLRLEQNLHDGAQQRLFAIRVKLDAARSHTGDEQLTHELDEIGEDASAAIEELRALAQGLYPAVLRTRGLADGLRAVAQTTTTPVEVVARDVPRCSERVEEAVYFCALEAIQNVSKHAGADARAIVTLERIGPGLAFAIVDDGVGFDPSLVAEGVGLVGMRDRIGAVGGEVDVLSQPGHGTTVRGVVPECWPAAA
jgi:signal transduction histidine kinase